MNEGAEQVDDNEEEDLLELIDAVDSFRSSIKSSSISNSGFRPTVINGISSSGSGTKDVAAAAIGHELNRSPSSSSSNPLSSGWTLSLRIIWRRERGMIQPGRFYESQIIIKGLCQQNKTRTFEDPFRFRI